MLARHVLGWDRAHLLARSREPAHTDFCARFSALIARRARREPVALITGSREFWGLDFRVSPATLVPRPETEFVVEEALRWLPAAAGATVLDVGTGSGCVGVSLAHERPNTRIVATDISHGALLVARENAAAHGVSARIRFVCADLTAGLRLRADVIVSNPPYVPDGAAPALSRDVAGYEPSCALFGGADGLGTMRRLLAGAVECLGPGGVLIVEFGDGQEEGMRGAAADAGWRVERIVDDLQGIARTAVLRR